MITSILDNDLYKFTMQNAVIKLFPYAKARYEFINRGEPRFPNGFAEELRKQIRNLARVELKEDEKKYLQQKCYYLDPTYIDFIKGFRFDPSEVKVSQQDKKLFVSIEGYWYRTILWEVPLMAIISELYFKMSGDKTLPEHEIKEKARKKAEKYDKLKVKVADFGTRRRYSYNNHDLIVNQLYQYGKQSFAGTSNVYLAMKYGVTPIGTHAHEWFMFHSAKFGYKMANHLALENWVNVYRGDLGIALSDTFTTDVFFRAFDKKYAKLFDGVRHDSGDPIEFTDKTIEHYKKLRIDPKTKSIIFSDSLNPDAVEKIAAYCRDKIIASFGIGTNFTNDVGVKPLNMVIKMVEAKPEGQEWMPVIKLSDTPGKHTGSEKAISLCKNVLRVDETKQ